MSSSTLLAKLLSLTDAELLAELKRRARRLPRSAYLDDATDVALIRESVRRWADGVNNKP